MEEIFSVRREEGEEDVLEGNEKLTLLTRAERKKLLELKHALGVLLLELVDAREVLKKQAPNSWKEILDAPFLPYEFAVVSFYSYVHKILNEE